jgi:hypothetical protein
MIQNYLRIQPRRCDPMPGDANPLVGSLVKLPTDSPVPPPIEMPPLDFSGDDKRDAVLDSMEHMLEVFRASSAPDSTGLVRDPGDILRKTIEKAEAADREEVRGLMATAKDLFDRSLFEQALAAFEHVARREPHYGPAHLGAATCLFRLDRDLESLRRLQPLWRLPAHDPVVDDARELRDELRKSLMLDVLVRVLGMTLDDGDDSVGDLLQELVELDPEYEAYRQLLDNVIEQKAKAALTPARDRFLAGDTSGALRLLKSVDSAAKQTQLYKSCFWFLSDGKVPQDIAVADTMHFFLLGPRMQDARAALHAEDFEKAWKVLERTVQLTPGFAYAHYLLAQAIYAGTAMRIGGGKPPSLDALIRDLEHARKAARMGASDPDVSESANEMVHILDEVLAAASDVQMANNVIGPLRERYQNLMEGIKDGISSRDQLTQLEAGLEALQRDVTAKRLLAKGEATRSAATALEEAIDRHFSQIAEAKHEMAGPLALQELGDRFNKRIEYLRSHPIASVSDARAAGADFEKMLSELRSLKSKLKGRQGNKMYKTLEETLDKHLAETRIAVAVGETADRFKREMEYLSTNKISSRWEARQAKENFESMLKDLRSLRRQVAGSQSAEAYQGLEMAINRVLAQLAGI